MKPGNLVRVKIRAPRHDVYASKLNGLLGIVLSPSKRGPLDVWRISLQNGSILTLEPVNLEVISETR